MASVFLENVARNERRRKQRERRSGVPRPFRGSRKQGIFNVSTRRKETLAGYNYIGFWGVGREGGRGGRSKSRLGKQGGMECVSTPLYVWSRDKKPGLPNFPPLESRATLRGRRRRRHRRRRRRRRRPHCGSLRLHRNVFLFAFGLRATALRNLGDLRLSEHTLIPRGTPFEGATNYFQGKR